MPWLACSSSSVAGSDVQSGSHFRAEGQPAPWKLSAGGSETMKYKALKSAAHNFGHSFASGLNWRGNDYVMSHLARAVVASGEVELNVDLLSGRADPAPLLTGPVQESVADYVRRFPDLLRSQRIEPEAVRVATMRIRFQPERQVHVIEGMGGWTIPFECMVGLTDDHGKVHQGRLVDEWAVDNFNVPPGLRRRLGWWLRDLRRAWHEYRLRHSSS